MRMSAQWTSVAALSTALFAATAPAADQELKYNRFTSATYAVSTEANGRAEGMQYEVYRLQFDKEAADPNRDQYQVRALQIGSWVQNPPLEFGQGPPLGISRGGPFERLTKIFDGGDRFAVLSPGVLEKRVFMFPVLDALATSTKEGAVWEFAGPPFIFPGQGNRLLKGELDVAILPRTKIKSEWTRTERIGQHQCAVIEFSFHHKLEEQPGEEHGEVSYSGTSYFSIALGVPVVNLLKGDGFFTSARGNKTTVLLRRKQVLIDVEK
jgi:hypothetical protein